MLSVGPLTPPRTLTPQRRAKRGGRQTQLRGEVLPREVLPEEFTFECVDPWDERGSWADRLP